MNDVPSPTACIALVAGDEAGIAALRPARETLEGFGIEWKEILLTSVDVPVDSQGLRAIVAASPDATLPAALAAATSLPVVRVPIPAAHRTGIDLLLDASTANLPGGDGAFATVAIGEAGAKNAALFVVCVLALTDQRLRTEWLAFRQRQTDAVLAHGTLADL